MSKWSRFCVVDPRGYDGVPREGPSGEWVRHKEAAAVVTAVRKKERAKAAKEVERIRARIAKLEAERAEVARELRAFAEQCEGCEGRGFVAFVVDSEPVAQRRCGTCYGWPLADLATRLERKVGPRTRGASATTAATVAWMGFRAALTSAPPTAPGENALRAQLAAAIPRAALVSALRERAAGLDGFLRALLSGEQEGVRVIAKRSECLSLADEIERGEWPKEGEGK